MKKLTITFLSLLLVAMCVLIVACDKQEEPKIEHMKIKKLHEYTIEKIIGQNSNLNVPAGVLIIDDKILVSDSKNNRLVLFNQNGNIIKIIGTTGNALGQFIEPRGIALDKYGNIYVIDAGNKRFQVLTHEFKFISQFTCDEFNTPRYNIDGLNDIKVDINNNIYVSMSTINKKYAHVFMIGSNKEIKKIGENLTGVLCTQNESVYFASQYELYESKGIMGGKSGKHVLINIKNGNIEKTVILPYSYTPVGICADIDNIYMLSYGYGTIDKYNNLSTYLGSIFYKTNNTQHQPGMTYMAIDSKKNIYVCDRIKNVVYKLIQKK